MEEYVRSWIGNSIPNDNKDDCNGNESTRNSDSSFSDLAVSPNFANFTMRRKTKGSTAKKIAVCVPMKNLENERLVRHLDYSRESGIMTLPDTILNGSEPNDTFFLSANEIHLPTGSDASIVSNKPGKDASSDYFTCTDISEVSNFLENNIFEVTSDRSEEIRLSSLLTEDQLVTRSDILSNKTYDEELSFVSLSEVYKYTDPAEGVVLFEKRLIVTPTM